MVETVEGLMAVDDITTGAWGGRSHWMITRGHRMEELVPPL